MKYSTNIYGQFLSSKSTCTKIEKVHNFTRICSKSNHISSSILTNLHGYSNFLNDYLILFSLSFNALSSSSLFLLFLLFNPTTANLYIQIHINNQTQIEKRRRCRRRSNNCKSAQNLCFLCPKSLPIIKPKLQIQNHHL